MAPPNFLIAAAQMTSSPDRARNLETAVRLVEEAADLGARLIGLPENFSYMGSQEGLLEGAETLEGPTLGAIREVARRRGVYVIAGSIAEKVQDPKRTANTSALIADDGTLVAAYRKIHLFDVNIPDGARYAESEVVAAGDQAIIAPTALGRIGLTICYDLRFPEMYAALVAAGAELVAVPSAFTEVTGRDHWHVLLRARAIEAQAWVLAPAQWGPHDDRGLRRSYGHSLIVDPWGVVVAEVGDGEGWCSAEIDSQRVAEVRRRIPVGAHRRLPLG